MKNLVFHLNGISAPKHLYDRGQVLSSHGGPENSHASHDASYTCNGLYNPPILLIDKIEYRIRALTAVPGARERQKLPDHLRGFFHNYYLERNGSAVLVGRGFSPLSTNGTRLVRCAQGLTYLRTYDRRENELNEGDWAYLRTSSSVPYTVQSKIFEEKVFEISCLLERAFGIPAVITESHMRTLEVYTEYPIPADEEEFFDRAKTIIARLHSESTHVKLQKRRQRYEACYEIDQPRSSEYRKLKIKLYRKARTFRLEVCFSNIKEKLSRLVGSVSNQFDFFQKLSANLIEPIHIEIVRGSSATRISVLRLWEVLQLKKFRSRIQQRDEFKEFVKQVAEFETYTPSKLSAEYRLSRDNIKRLCDPTSGILSLSPRSKKNRRIYLLRNDWDRDLPKENLSDGASSNFRELALTLPSERPIEDFVQRSRCSGISPPNAPEESTGEER